MNKVNKLDDIRSHSLFDAIGNSDHGEFRRLFNRHDNQQFIHDNYNILLKYARDNMESLQMENHPYQDAVVGNDDSEDSEDDSEMIYNLIRYEYPEWFFIRPDLDRVYGSKLTPNGSSER